VSILAVVVSFALLLVVTPAAQAVPSCPGADGAVESIGKQKAAEAVMCLINAERVASGVGALAPDSRLSLAARWHADDMVARNYFSHDAPPPSPHGDNSVARARNAGFPYDGDESENLVETTGLEVGGSKDPQRASNYSSTPREVFAIWLESPGHCYTMLLDVYTLQGVGLARRPNNRWVWALEVGNLAWVMEEPSQPNCGYNRKPTVTPLDPGLPGEKKVLTETSPRPKHCAKPRLAGVKPRRHGKVLRVAGAVGGAQRYMACLASSSGQSRSQVLKVRVVARQPHAKKRVHTVRVNGKGRLTATLRLAKAQSGSVTVSIPGVKYSAQWFAFR
jgi:uncharacterized protein YkwD